MVANMEDPPYETNGRGTPVIGMMPSVIPMFSNAWKQEPADDADRDQAPEHVLGLQRDA